MPANPAHAPSLREHLAESLRLGAPDVCGALAVFPLFGPPARLDYVSFAQGRAAGATIKELEQGASVNDLLVLNPTDHNLLLYEGDRQPRLDLAVPPARRVDEGAPVLREVEVAARRDVLVHVQARPVGQLDLEHPHEPVRERHPDERPQRLPVGLLVLADVAGDGSVAEHAASLPPQV